ncbi:MAG: STAS domain-containing protein [Lachnospiraceae bacterium]|jgi:anti-sigma B factor antagonist|nr:STAS domain-containing protein [Lachnospiraceae bacterium]
MTIQKNREADILTVAVEGRLDTTTAPQLEEELNASIDGVKELVLDLVDLAYVSSAGLRVLLSAQKTMNKQGSMVIKNANEEVMEIFEVTGFIDILNIEE